MQAVSPEGDLLLNRGVQSRTAAKGGIVIWKGSLNYTLCAYSIPAADADEMSEAAAAPYYFYSTPSQIFLPPFAPLKRFCLNLPRLSRRLLLPPLALNCAASGAVPVGGAAASTAAATAALEQTVCRQTDDAEACETPPRTPSAPLRGVPEKV